MRRGQDPALQTGGNGQFSRKPRATVHPCREAYMPPLQIRVSPTRTQKRYLVANGHGPHACGPYKPSGNGRRTGKAGACHRASAAGSRPRPTNRRKRSIYPQTPRGAHPYRAACMPPLQIRGSRTRTKNVTIRQTPTGRIHAAPTNRPGSGRRTCKAGACHRASTAGSRPRPTKRRKRPYFPRTSCEAHPCREPRAGGGAV